MKINLEGECTVERAGEIRELLLRGLADKEKTEISFSRVEAVDLAFFQLLHAASRSFAKAGRPLILQSDLDQRFAARAHLTGLQGIVAGQPG